MKAFTDQLIEQFQARGPLVGKNYVDEAQTHLEAGMLNLAEAIANPDL